MFRFLLRIPPILLTPLALALVPSSLAQLPDAPSALAVARTYEGHATPNLAGLGGKAGAQAVSTTYYPPGSETFGVLAKKFRYACARDMGFTVFREFYPDIAIHILHRNP